MSSLRVVGYWTGDEVTGSGFPDPRDAVDPRWDPIERQRVVDYLRGGRVRLRLHGYSWCRFRCGIDDAEMGSRDLSDGAWVWPEGYAHYLEAHDVRPPGDFLEHVRDRLAAGAHHEQEP